MRDLTTTGRSLLLRRVHTLAEDGKDYMDEGQGDCAAQLAHGRAITYRLRASTYSSETLKSRSLNICDHSRGSIRPCPIIACAPLVSPKPVQVSRATRIVWRDFSLYLGTNLGSLLSELSGLSVYADRVAEIRCRNCCDLFGLGEALLPAD